MTEKQSCLSDHLACVRDCGLVVTARTAAVPAITATVRAVTGGQVRGGVRVDSGDWCGLTVGEAGDQPSYLGEGHVSVPPATAADPGSHPGRSSVSRSGRTPSMRKPQVGRKSPAGVLGLAQGCVWVSGPMVLGRCVDSVGSYGD
ncbi:hypothetical protein GTY87_01045 [Streptomyces sp. SID7813]|uniref:Uncharacterized protein n=1 Tax=Streptomyces coelicolor (strain ATCC BAA-471 / A3(2) / M145) TaxID=100226 RepID=Q9S1R6_STRCO|nr:hypothetical protein [Streptomyces sp. SID7813]QFI40518.1 hypothetical protein FQ762_01070 [Streptomyces coelicolor A3(2)]CAB53265.1 hypothetical protein [Streptomyces coelicolor A3(2)]